MAQQVYRTVGAFERARESAQQLRNRVRNLEAEIAKSRKMKPSKRSKTEPSKTSKKAEHEIPAVNMGASSSTTPMETSYSEEPEDTDDQ